MATTPNRRAKKKTAPAANKTAPAAKKNRRAPPRKRTHRAQARTATYREPTIREPLVAPDWLYPAARVMLALWVLLPAALVTASAFLDTFTAATIGGSALHAPAFWFFLFGLGTWCIAFAVLTRPMTAYVLGHELTHAFFILLHGGRIEKFEVTPEGGYVVTDKNNLIISLSPYFVPFYSVVLIIAAAITGLFVDFTHHHTGLFFGFASFKWLWAIFALIGLSWGFHLTFTIWMIAKDQPDLREYGIFFSLVLIFLVNVLIITGGLVLASPDTTVASFAEHWQANATDLTAWAGRIASAAFGL